MEEKRKQPLTIKQILTCCVTCLTLCLAALEVLIAGYLVTTNMPIPDLLRFRVLGAPPLRLTGEFFTNTGGLVIPPNVAPSTLQGRDQSIMTWLDKWPRVAKYSTGTTVRLDITSLSMDEWVTLEKTMLFKIVDYQPLRDWVNVLGSEMGGVHSYRHFEVEIAPSQIKNEIFRADFNPASSYAEEGIDLGSILDEAVRDYFFLSPGEPDYFSLSPGEKEIFVSDVRFKEPGLYTFTFGVEYSYKGERKTTWIKRGLTVYVPSKWYVWIRSVKTLSCQNLRVPVEEREHGALGYREHCEPVTN